MAYCCPNCGSRDFFALKKAIALAKGLLGALAFGSIGSLFEM